MSNDKTIMVKGRIVWTSGDLFKGRPKLDQTTRQPRLDKQGNQMIEFGFGLAVPKATLGTENAEIWNAIHEMAYSIYPSRQVPPAFAWKKKDGDTDIDESGVSYSVRQGYAGHLVFACTTTIPIKYFKWDGQQNIMISEGIKCGDYVNVQLNVKAHPAVGTSKPGLYLNPYLVQLVAVGEAIINTPSGNQVFGTAAPVAPAGYIAPSAPAIPQGFAPQPQYQQPMAPQPQYAPPPQQPVAAPQPNWGVVPQAMQPQMPAPVPAAPQYAQPQYQQPAPQPQYAPQPAYPQAAPAPVGFPPPPGR